MANRISDAALNIAAEALTSQTITARVHSGSPGNNGTANRIGNADATIAAAGWTDGGEGALAAGEVATEADTTFGVLSSSSTQTVRAYSLWRGNTFLGWADLDAAVAVDANESFVIDAGTIKFEVTRP